MGKNVTSQNYLSHYTAWCAKNSFAPLRYDILIEIFYNCESQDDFKNTLDTLYTIQNSGARLSFMKDDKTIEALSIRLHIRLELFKRIPTATNMLLAYNLIEEITLKTYASGQVDLTDEINKFIDKFDKLKNLALSTKFIPERKLAFEKSVEVFNKLVKV